MVDKVRDNLDNPEKINKDILKLFHYDEQEEEDIIIEEIVEALIDVL